MVNEEDHLRHPGARARIPARRVLRGRSTRSTTRWSSELEFAFADELGYLTACPTNVGTGHARVGPDAPAGAGPDAADQEGPRRGHAGRPHGARVLRRGHRGHGQLLPDLEPDHAGREGDRRRCSTWSGWSARCWSYEEKARERPAQGRRRADRGQGHARPRGAALRASALLAGGDRAGLGGPLRASPWACEGLPPTSSR